MKNCPKCGEIKPLTDFYKRRDRTATSWCKRCVLDQQSERYHANPEPAKQRASLHRTSTMRGRSYMSYHAAKQRARKQGVPFDLDLDSLTRRYEAGICEATGIKFNFDHPGFIPTLDRTEPHKGYVMDNVKVVVRIYNMAKAEGSHADVLRLCHALTVQ